jgi:hypothetical protein
VGREPRSIVFSVARNTNANGGRRGRGGGGRGERVDWYRHSGTKWPR